MGNSNVKSKFLTLCKCPSTRRPNSVASSSITSSSMSSSSSKSTRKVEEASPEKFRIIRKIGKGSFGKVYAVEKRDSKDLFAMKLVEKDLETNEDQIQDINKEIEILSSVNHPFLITLWYAFQDEDYVYLVFELIPGGDLRRSIQDQGRLSEARTLIHVCETALALDYLKMKKILHRDIKPENLLLDSQGHIRLIDFNTAIKLEDGRLATSMTGTKPYIAPEVYRCALDLDPGYSFPADWWSLGICAYEMLCGKRPYDIHSFTSYEDILGMFLFSKIEFPEHVEKEMADLVTQILCVETEHRLSSVDCLRLHPYLKNVNFNQMYTQEIKTTLCQNPFDRDVNQEKTAMGRPSKFSFPKPVTGKHFIVKSTDK